MAVTKCHVCGRRFTKSEHAKRHERSHTGEKSYKCNVCHKRFSRRDVLTRHAKSHKAPTPVAPTTGIPDLATPIDLIVNQPSNPAASDESSALGLALAETQSLQTATMITQNLPSSESHAIFDSLAELSAHQVIAEGEINLTANKDQKSYIESYTPPTSSGNEEIDIGGILSSDDKAQFWMERYGDTDSNSYSPDFVQEPNRASIEANVLSSPEGHDHQFSVGCNRAELGELSPFEKHMLVQNHWSVLSNHTEQIMENLWQIVASTGAENVFSMKLPLSRDFPRGPSHHLDESCRLDLQALFDETRYTMPYSTSQGNLASSFNGPTLSFNTLPGFPSVDDLNIALDMYFRRFHPLVPFVHVPSFSAKATRLPLLYVMCLIGMVFLGTENTRTFVSANLPLVLEKLIGQFATHAFDNEDTLTAMSTFAAAFLFLNLAAMTEETKHLGECQILFGHLLSTAQRHGLFEAHKTQTLDLKLIQRAPDVDTRWKAWARVESVKRLIAGIVLLDSWYGSFLSTTRITVPGCIQLVLPSSDALFAASTAMQWTHIIQKENDLFRSSMTSSPAHISIPQFSSLRDNFCVQVVLAVIQLRLSEAYQRLLADKARYPFIPCHVYAVDHHAQYLPLIPLQIVSDHTSILERPNSAIMWHRICLELTADVRIFELAAGCDGPIPAQKALGSIALWSRTTAARRACLHAGHIYKAMADRKASENITFHSAFSLFSAALVMGFYFLTVPNNVESQFGGTPIELLDKIDWRNINTEGFLSLKGPNSGQCFVL